MIAAILIGFLGLVCFYAEFFLPGGILAILGVMIVIASSFLFCLKANSWALGFGYIIMVLVASIFACYLALKHLKKSGKHNTFFLQSSQEGFSVSKIEEDLQGKEGLVYTELKPAGHVRIEGKIYQAVSEGPFLAKDQKVRVVALKGSHVLVQIKEEE
jgi:membrane-bound serine protease (ClpP class)